MGPEILHGAQEVAAGSIIWSSEEMEKDERWVWKCKSEEMDAARVEHFVFLPQTQPSGLAIADLPQKRPQQHCGSMKKVIHGRFKYTFIRRVYLRTHVQMRIMPPARKKEIILRLP